MATVACMEGHAPAGGCILGLTCDERVMYGNFDIIFGPFLAHFSAPPHPARAVCCDLYGACADLVLIGAWNLMLVPIWGCRASGRIGLNETVLGLAPPWWICDLLCRVVGEAKGEQMLQRGTLLDPTGAAAIGLIDTAVDAPAELMPAAEKAMYGDFGIISDITGAFLSSTPPHTRRCALRTSLLCTRADRCLESHVVTNFGLQAVHACHPGSGAYGNDFDMVFGGVF